MAIPDFQSIMRPLLAGLADGQERSVQTMRDTLAERFGLGAGPRQAATSLSTDQVVADLTHLEGVVWLCENWDIAYDPPRGTGRFSGYWETPGALPQEELELTTSEAAVQWGRERAGIVHVRLANSNVIYSAGAHEPPVETPPWPGEAEARRRESQ